jgi:hypothetical protein
VTEGVDDRDNFHDDAADGRAADERQDETDERLGAGEGQFGAPAPRSKAVFNPTPGSEFKNIREQMFVDALLSDPERNVPEAAQRAGFGNGNRDHAGRYGRMLMRNPRIIAAIARREAAANVMIPELVGMRVECARNAHIGNVIDVFEDGTFNLNLLKAVETGAIEWINELRFDRYGRPVIKMEKRLAALEQLDAIFGLKSEQRPQDALEERKRAKIEGVLAGLREGDPEKYKEFVRRLMSNPETRKYVALIGAAGQTDVEAEPGA